MADWHKISQADWINVSYRIPDGQLRLEFLGLALHCLNEGGFQDDDDEIAFIVGLSVARVKEMRPYLNRLSDISDGKLMIRIVGEAIEERAEFGRKQAARATGGKRQPPNAAEDQGEPPSPAPSPKESKKNKKSHGKPRQATASHGITNHAVNHADIQDSGTNVPGADAPDEAQPVEEPVDSAPPAPPSPSVIFKQSVVAAFCDTLAELDADAPPYQPTAADVIQIEALRKRCLKGKDGVPWELTPARLSKALANYRASPIGQRTLADFAVRFSTFYAHALDQYRNPAGATNGTNGTNATARNRSETANERNARELATILAASAAAYGGNSSADGSGP